MFFCQQPLMSLQPPQEMGGMYRMDPYVAAESGYVVFVPVGAYAPGAESAPGQQASVPQAGSWGAMLGGCGPVPASRDWAAAPQNQEAAPSSEAPLRTALSLEECLAPQPGAVAG